MLATAGSSTRGEAATAGQILLHGLCWYGKYGSDERKPNVYDSKPTILGHKFGRIPEYEGFA
ncbi:hypothetical protein G3M48_008413 [Beauveria asiatica]|uniref:Uncharacterized protein n=1 Tax=Beauveria asiatica TaxID=1069075 RepID=A0AAW0RKG7_9HYPO